MTETEDGPVVPLTVLERVEFLRRRRDQYFGGLVDPRFGEAGFIENVDAIAWTLAESDLLAILGRKGDRAFRLQMHAEKIGGLPTASELGLLEGVPR